MGKNEKQNKSYWKLSKRKRLGLERFKYGIRWDFYIYVFALLVIVVYLSYYTIKVLQNTQDDTEFLTFLIPIILLFQLLLVYGQTINQYKSNRITKIGFLPIISIYSKLSSFQVVSKDEEFIVGIKNTGTDAHNVQYTIKIDDKVVKSDVDLFLLSRDEEKEIHNLSKEDLIKKQIDVYISYEDMVKSPPYKAIFRKDANSETFKTLTTGLY